MHAYNVYIGLRAQLHTHTYTCIQTRIGAYRGIHRYSGERVSIIYDGVLPLTSSDGLCLRCHRHRQRPPCALRQFLSSAGETPE